ncbi:MAG: AraC family transcriptional regulator [Clostridium sp.]|nr:AraC family transcriptional regulator [Clostridium sp.]MCM1209657.1 AraC family transcriptional regulator [Ruminococcus sp.]
MNWVKIIEDAICYIEEHITEDLTVSRIAKEVNISAFYFQRGFSVLCGYTVGEYIRMRRLSLAGNELLSSDSKVIDLAMKYGYDSPDSFTKAFIRFHGSSPTDVRRNGAILKAFAPLHIKLSLDGGSVMEYRIEEKAAFQVMGLSQEFSYESANADIPKYWDAVVLQAKERPVMGMYGVCFDEEMAGNQFRYMVADDFIAGQAEEKGLEVYDIPAHTWAVFPCRGAMPLPLQEVNRKIFSEWLPASSYEIAEGYNIEYYSNPADYKNGMQDSEYYSEVWIPVKKK